MLRVLLTAGLALGLVACGDAEDGGVANGPIAIEDGSAELELELTGEHGRSQPMPALEVRAQRVLAELGDDDLRVIRSLDGEDRRSVLENLTPRARASLRRHNVRVEQIARHLGDTFR